MRLVILILLLILNSCGGDDSATGSGESVVQSKDLFSLWSNRVTGDSVDLSGGAFDTNLSLTNVSVTVDASWVSTLSAAGRVNLPSAGTTYICDYDLYIVGSNSSGGFALDTNDDTDSIANNACLLLDSNCANGTACHYSSDHTYSNSNAILSIDWFGTGDSGEIGVDTYD